MHILERIRRCRHCGSDMTDTTSSSSYRENPFCGGCLEERLQNAAATLGPIRHRRVGQYIEPIQVNQTVS